MYIIFLIYFCRIKLILKKIYYYIVGDNMYNDMILEKMFDNMLDSVSKIKINMYNITKEVDINGESIK